MKILAQAASILSKPWYTDTKSKRKAEYHADIQGSSFGPEREFGRLALKRVHDKRSK